MISLVEMLNLTTKIRGIHMLRKKTYESPEMRVLVLKAQSRLMESSGGGYTGGGAYLDNEKDPIA